MLLKSEPQKWTAKVNLRIKVTKREINGRWRHTPAMASCQYFLEVSMIWFRYTDKSYIKILGVKIHHKNNITTGTFGLKSKENNENDMNSVVWVGTVFGPRLGLLSARRNSHADLDPWWSPHAGQGKKKISVHLLRSHYYTYPFSEWCALKKFGLSKSICKV